MIILIIFPPSLISMLRPLASWIDQCSLITIFNSNYPSISRQDSSQMPLSPSPGPPRSLSLHLSHRFQTAPSVLCLSSHFFSHAFFPPSLSLIPISTLPLLWCPAQKRKKKKSYLRLFLGRTSAIKHAGRVGAKGRGN